MKVVGTHEYYGNIYEVSAAARAERQQNWVEQHGFGTGQADVFGAEWFELWNTLKAANADSEDSPIYRSWCPFSHVFAKTPDGGFGHVGIIEFHAAGTCNRKRDTITLTG